MSYAPPPTWPLKRPLPAPPVHVLAPPTTRSFLELAMNGDGARWLQGQLPRMTAEDKEWLLEALLPHVLRLAEHKFANYVLQAIARDVPCAISDALEDHVGRLSVHAKGCRVVQTLFATLPTSKARALATALRGRAVCLAKDANGKYSLLAALRYAKEEWMLEEVAAAAPQGSVFLQRLLDPEHTKRPRSSYESARTRTFSTR